MTQDYQCSSSFIRTSELYHFPFQMQKMGGNLGDNLWTFSQLVSTFQALKLCIAFIHISLMLSDWSINPVVNNDVLFTSSFTKF